MDEKSRKKACPQSEIYIPPEVRIRYFPPNKQPETFDVLPLYGLKEYHERLVHEVSILENAEYAKKWKEFRDGLPETARAIKGINFKSDKIPCFVNQVRRKMPKDYYLKQQKAPCPDPIFYKSKFK